MLFFQFKDLSKHITYKNFHLSCKSCHDSIFVLLTKVAGEQEVRGQIKLKFRDVTGSPIVVTRTLVSLQKVCTLRIFINITQVWRWIMLSSNNFEVVEREIVVDTPTVPSLAFDGSLVFWNQMWKLMHLFFHYRVKRLKQKL